jgi:hypothetical protein
MKNFVKLLDRNGSAFSFLCEKFPRLSMEKIKVGVFVGPQIHQLFKDPQFELVLRDDEKAAWNAFQHVTGFQGNAKLVKFRKLVKDLVTSHEKLGFSMSLKMHFLQSHLDLFLVNCGTVSDEYIEHFQQDMSVMEGRYKGKWSAAILADYCWMVKKDALEIQYKWQAKRHLI